MEITNEEMEVLNRASEILSKYAAQGGLTREDFDYYEDMVVAIIDGHKPHKVDTYKYERQMLIAKILYIISIVEKRKKYEIEANPVNLSLQSPAVLLPEKEARTTDDVIASNTISLFSTPIAQASGEYSEELMTGGELVITPKGWSIRYYLLEPNQTYVDSHVIINGENVDSYIDAWKKNYSKYCDLKQTASFGSTYSLIGDMGMNINIGGDDDGICFYSFHRGIKTETDVDEIINDYVYAKERARQLLPDDTKNEYSESDICIRESVQPSPNAETVKEESPDSLFKFSPYRDGVIITKYIGFDESEIRIPQTICGKNVVALGEKAFYKADKIITVEIPDTVISIRDGCFDSCTRLENVVLPKNLKAIGSRAFSETAINTIILPDTVFYMGDSVFAKTPIHKVILPSSLFVVPGYAFSNCKQLTEVIISEGISEISFGAFSDCKALKSVSMYSGLIEIGDGAFTRCPELKEVNIPDSVEKIEEYAFDDKIIVRCSPGSYAQEYARSNGFQLVRTETKYHQSNVKNEKVYMMIKPKPGKGVGTIFKGIVLTAEDELSMVSYLQSRNADWVKINNTTLCVRSNDPDIEQKAQQAISNRYKDEFFLWKAI